MMDDIIKIVEKEFPLIREYLVMDRHLTNEIEKEPQLKLKNIRTFNTSYAKSRVDDIRDEKNLILLTEFECNGKLFCWKISEDDILKLRTVILRFWDVNEYNKKYDREGRKYHESYQSLLASRGIK